MKYGVIVVNYEDEEEFEKIRLSTPAKNCETSYSELDEIDCAAVVDMLDDYCGIEE